MPADEATGVAAGALEAIDGRAAFRLLLRVTGAFALAWAIPELAGQAMARVMVYHVRQQDLWTQALPAVVKLAIGVYFLRGGPHVVRLAYGEGAD